MPRRYNRPPNWPAPPVGWTPHPGWQPDPAWGPPPPGWQVWIDEPPAGRWWAAPPLVVAALVLVFPIGVVAMWAGRVWNRVTRWVITGVAALVVVAMAASGGNAPSIQHGVAAAAAVSTATTAPSTTPSPAPSTAAPSPPPARTSSAPAKTATASSTGDVLLAGAAVVLPNRTRTPGATNGEVTQANIDATICLTGYTKTIRPPSSYTTSLKEQQLASGYAYDGDLSTSDYEEDHLISLELGGAPSDVRNLWPEPYAATDGARVKDRVENKLHDLVCSGALPLATAQRAIATDWWQAYQTYGGEGSPVVWDGSYGTTSSTGSSTVSTSPTPATGGYVQNVHPGAFCSQHGAYGYTSSGTLMTCKTSPTDARYRWRAA